MVRKRACLRVRREKGEEYRGYPSPDFGLAYSNPVNGILLVLQISVSIKDLFRFVRENGGQRVDVLRGSNI